MKKYNRLFLLSIAFVFLDHTLLLYSADAFTNNYYSKPDAIINEVKSRGANAVVAELTKDAKVWDFICNKIATGDQTWLKAAAALKAGTDADSGEMLDLALGEALEHEPENVFKIAANTFELAFICGGPDVDNARYNSYELSMKAIDLRTKKVAAVKDQSLQKMSKECLKYLEESKKGIAEFFQEKGQ